MYASSVDFNANSVDFNASSVDLNASSVDFDDSGSVSEAIRERLDSLAQNLVSFASAMASVQAT